MLTQWWPTLTRIEPGFGRELRRIPNQGARGFSLIEVLISMVLALITFLIMFQMFESWDKNNRSTASGGGAMISGAMAMFRLERDLRLAGFGFGSASEMGCDVRAYYSTRAPESSPGSISGLSSTAISDTDSNHKYRFPLVPFQIVSGPNGEVQLAVMYGSSEGVSAGQFFGTTAAGAQAYTGSTNSTITMDVGGRGGIHQGDLVVATDGTNCYLTEVTNSSNSDRRTFEFTTSDYTSYYTNATTTPRYNLAGYVSLNATGNVYVLGPRPQRRIWHIRNGRTLAFANDFWTDDVNNASGVAGSDGVNDVPFTEVADNIVGLQAQYAFMATVSGSTCTASATPVWTATAPTNNCLWPFLWAIRVALLARSDQFEKTWGVPGTSSAVAPRPSWNDGGLPFTMTDVGGTSAGTADSFASATLTNPSKNPNDWRHYRYRVFEAVIPLKNVMWASR